MRQRYWRNTWLAAGIACGLWLVGIATPTQAAEPTGRNIVFIAVDDMRTWAGYTGDYPGTIHTPNIDALARTSTRYLNAYATVPQCMGSRTSVMLGLSPARHGLDAFSWGDPDPAYRSVYDDPGLLSLPEVLAANGYHTASTGKVFHIPLPDRWGETGPATIRSLLASAFRAGDDGAFFSPGVTADGERHPDQIVADWSSDFIADYASTAPFFLAVGFYLPHVPWNVPRWAFDLYPLEDVIVQRPLPGDLDDEPALAVAAANAPLLHRTNETQYEAVIRTGRAAAFTRAYLASLSHTDAMIGQVLDALANSPHAGNTDVILWSDNGYHLGEKFHWRKDTFWQQSVKVPLLVNSPGNPAYPAATVTEAVSLLDLAPTVIDLAGLPPFGQFEGVPLHDDTNRGPIEIFSQGGKARIVDGWKIVDYDTDGPRSLDDMAAYWLDVDPDESRNVIRPLIRAIIRQIARQRSGN